MTFNGGGTTGESAEGYRDIGMPPVAAALCCEQMPEPADERDDKRPPL
jgi:hypothetical protein